MGIKKTSSDSNGSMDPAEKQYKVILGFMTIMLVLVVFLLTLVFLGSKDSISKAISGSDMAEFEQDYQAVFLTNGQVYFGKVDSRTELELVLSEIYYLQINRDLQATGTEEASEEGNEQAAAQDQPELSLVKLGNELHGPTDKMIINTDQVLFVEDLKDDSRVVEAISNYQE